MSISTIIKVILLAFILTILIVACFIATQETFFWPVMKWIRSIRGYNTCEGEDCNAATFSILLEIILPVIYVLSFGMVYKRVTKQSQ